MEVKLKRLVYKGAQEICNAVGVNWKNINYHVDKEGLPAFKIRGNWIALPSELEEWLKEQSRKRREVEK